MGEVATRTPSIGLSVPGLEPGTLGPAAAGLSSHPQLVVDIYLVNNSKASIDMMGVSV